MGRHAMLINHVDRGDTHIASAVLQVHQDCDEDGGWPLEVHSEDGEAYEVYLQPGEMVLYEGRVWNIFAKGAGLDTDGPCDCRELNSPTSLRTLPLLTGMVLARAHSSSPQCLSLKEGRKTCP